MTTRRRLIQFLSATAATLPLPLFAQSRFFAAKPKKHNGPPQPLVFFGTDTDKGGKGIYVSRFDPAQGQLTAPILAAESFRPAYLALGQAGNARLLYATNEGDAHSSTVTTYRLDPATGHLSQIGQVPAGSAGPCYISVDPGGRAAYTANYMGSSVSVFKIKPDGSLAAPDQVIDFRQKLYGHHGPNAERQDAPHPHSAMFSPDGRFLLVNDLGNDNIAVFPIESNANLGTVRLTESRLPGAGPRHVAFHPNGRWVYGIDEISSQINQYLWNTVHGSKGMEEQALLTDMGHTVSTLDPGFHGQNTAAEIAISPNGYYVYASNRGDDSLVVFSVQQTDGALTPVQRISCAGKTPRHFTLDSTGNWLLCGNQNSASVTVFSRDATSGKLAGPVQTIPVESPMFMLFA